MVRDQRGVFWMACRMRTADSPLGLRGYEIRILRSEDGIHFRKVHSIPREKAPIPGFERPSLLRDPKTGRFKLYGCGPWKGGPWSIIKFDDAEDPTRFEPVGDPRESIMPLAGWHDPVYNIATGLAFTFDLHHITDLTPDSPLVVSTTPSDQFHTWRYSHWMWVGEELWAYAEVARPDRTNEIRLFRLRR